MRSLKESILSTNNARVKWLRPDNIKMLYPKTRINSVFDMYKMYVDASKEIGKKPDNHAEAFCGVLFKGGKWGIEENKYKQLFNEDTKTAKRNSICSEILNEKFHDYINTKHHFNFFLRPSPWEKDVFILGVFVWTKDLPSYEIVDIKV